MENSVGICDNMPILEIIPAFLDYIFNNFKDLPRPVQIHIEFLVLCDSTWNVDILSG